MSETNKPVYEIPDFNSVTEFSNKPIPEQISNEISSSIESKENKSTPYDENLNENLSTFLKKFIDGFKRMEIDDIDPNLTEIE
ncbi:hypothetical protein C6P40_004673, partial [Pichia californica]